MTSCHDDLMRAFMRPAPCMQTRMLESESEYSREAAAAALANLAANSEETQAAIAAAGGRPGGRAGGQARGRTGGRGAGRAAAPPLSIYRGSLRAHGGVLSPPPWARRWESSDPPMHCSTHCSVILYVSQSTHGSVRFSIVGLSLPPAGAIPALVGALRLGGTPAAAQHAARALRNLAGRDNANKLRTAEAGRQAGGRGWWLPGAARLLFRVIVCTRWVIVCTGPAQLCWGSVRHGVQGGGRL